MKTSDLFRAHRSAKRINESMEKLFGTKLDLQSFDLPKLEDARNKLRTQLSQVRNNSEFNENIENEAVTQAQWMLDAINAEIMEREEFIADPHLATVSEESDGSESEIMRRIASGELDAYQIMNSPKGPEEEAASKIVNDMYNDIINSDEIGSLHPDDDFEQILDMVVDKIADEYGTNDDGYDDEGGETDDAYALASAGHGSDEDYGSFGYDEGVKTEGYKKFGASWAEELAKTVFDMNPNLSAKGKADELQDAGFKIAVEKVGKKRAQYDFGYDEDFPSDFVSAYNWLQMGGNPETGEDGEEYTKKYGHLFKGQDEAMESAPPTAKGERMVKHIKKGYAKDGKLTDKEKSIAYATAWKQHNKEKNESVDTGDIMTRKLTEGEIQQAQSIVTAKTMVDRVGRWIEELSGMENDTLLQLGDQIRDEMSADQAKSFISSVAPAIQQALQNLKDTRETLATGVRMLTGEEQGAEMLGAEPGADMGDEMGPAEPDMMNDGGDELDSLTGDEFAAAEPAAGGLETAGREQRESIDRSNNLLRVLAG